MVCLHILAFFVAASLMEPSRCSVMRPQPASHLMLDYNWPEPDFKIQKYPHEKYCHYFYKWESGDIYTIRKCPKGEIFDYHIHDCKNKKEAKCFSQVYGKTKGHDHIHSKLKKHFDCPFSSGRYPDIFICEKYFVCKDGVSYQKHCPPTKLFDRIRRQCVDESVALCADVTDAQDIHHRCPKPSGTFGHARDCSKYYTCKHGEPTLKQCNNGELFNDVELYCATSDVQCGNRSNPYSDAVHENVENSTLPHSEPARNLSKSDLKITSGETDSKSQSSLPVTSSPRVEQTTVSEMTHSPTTASENSNKGNPKERKTSEKPSTSNDTTVFSTEISTEKAKTT